MKKIGIIIGSLVGVTASASVCDSPDCPACKAVGNTVMSAWPVLISGLAVAAVGFKAFRARRGGMAALLGFLLAFVSPSFADDKKAADTTAAPASVTIAELLAKPDAYAGKQVTVKARLADACTADGCLVLKDKFDVIEGKPPAESFKKTPKVGSTLNVTGTVTVKGEGKKKEVAIAVKSFDEVKK